MKTTVEIPDDLMTEVKVLAARERRKLGEMMTDLLQAGIESFIAQRSGQKSPGEQKEPTVYDLMKKSIGIADSGIPDLGSNPKHLEGLGRDSKGHR